MISSFRSPPYSLSALLDDTYWIEVFEILKLIAAQNEVGNPFEFDEILQQMVARQSEINSALEFEELKRKKS